MSSSDALPYDVLYAASISLTATTFVSGISWGFMTSLYAVCMYSLIGNLRSTRAKATSKTALLTAWITVLWILSSLSTIANAYCSIYAYSWQMDYPGGPPTYLANIWSQSVPALAYSTYLLTMWLADAMMLWRLFIFYHGVRPLTRGLILSFMSLIYVGVVGTGCFTLAINSSNQTLYSQLAKTAAIPCFTLSVTLNVFSTAFISIRVLLFKKQVEKALGREEAQTSPYTSVVAMLIESSALYATWSLVFIIVYAVGNPGQYILLMTLCNVQVISPTLIVYRVSKGVAWERRTTNAILTSTQMLFSEGRGGSETLLEARNPKRHGTSTAGSKMVFSSNPSPVEKQ
ncbi:hypothetical protein HD554DRAFT_2186146 [Boletus coccyginus]|nr:hypothetical protein HD554DRAFT_2186146 [Boletus coccyginus]